MDVFTDDNDIMPDKDWKKIGKLVGFIGEITIFTLYSVSS
jgi:hypothetical protein